MRIGAIIPYLPDAGAGELFERCTESIPRGFEQIISVDFNHEGVSNMRNEGLDEMLQRGVDYITFLDADDTMQPDAYDQICAAIEEEPEEQIIQLNHYRQRPNEAHYCRFYNRRGTYELNNLPQLWVVVWNKVYKAELLENIRFVPGLDHGEDEVFNLECLAKARRIYCSDRIHMTHHFDNPNSLSKTIKPEDLINEQRCLLKVMKDHIDDKKLTEAIRLRQLELWTNNAYRRAFGGL